jgi:hypothetical protein
MSEWILRQVALEKERSVGGPFLLGSSFSFLLFGVL